MSHFEVFKKLEEVFPFYATLTEIWFPNGRNSIRIRMKDGQELVFSCANEGGFQFRLETLPNYIKSMKGDSREK